MLVIRESFEEAVARPDPLPGPADLQNVAGEDQEGTTSPVPRQVGHVACCCIRPRIVFTSAKKKRGVAPLEARLIFSRQPNRSTYRLFLRSCILSTNFCKIIQCPRRNLEREKKLNLLKKKTEYPPLVCRGRLRECSSGVPTSSHFFTYTPLNRHPYILEIYINIH